MATQNRGRAAAPPRRLGQQQQSNAPRRLGQQPASRPQSGGAQRPAARRKQSFASRWPWLSVALVVVVIAVFAIVKVTSSNPTGNSPTGADRNPALASQQLVANLVSTPLAVQSAAGTGAQKTSPFSLVTGKNALSSSSGGIPRVAFVGAEFCPYCAVDRYALILGLSRFGAFHNLKVTQSGTTDGDIPTFSFLGSTYTSPYVKFTPYEQADRLGNLLESPPAAINSLWENEISKATNGSSKQSYPWANFGGKYTLAAFPSGMSNTLSILEGPSSTGAGIPQNQIIAGIHSPNSTQGQVIQAGTILSDANFVDGAVCLLDGGNPASVCQAPGVKAAMSVITKSSTKL